MPCKCGRESKPQHCPNCGRRDVYATKRNDRLLVVEGQKYIARGFRCRKCGNEFDESTQCEAPVRGFSVAAQRAEVDVENALTGLAPSERHARLQDMFGKKGKKQ